MYNLAWELLSFFLIIRYILIIAILFGGSVLNIKAFIPLSNRQLNRTPKIISYFLISLAGQSPYGSRLWRRRQSFVVWVLQNKRINHYSFIGVVGELFKLNILSITHLLHIVFPINSVKLHNWKVTIDC